LRAYMDETEEEDVETKEEIIDVKEEGEEGDEGENNKGQTEATLGGMKKEAEKEEEAEKAKNEKEALTSMATIINVDTDDIANTTSNTISNTASEGEKLGQLVINKEESSINIMDDIETPKSLKFNDKDEAMTSNGNIETINAPKDIDRLEKISEENYARRKAEEEEEDDEEDSLNIGSDVMLELDDIVSLEEAKF
jgi:hypothetical protein